MGKTIKYGKDGADAFSEWMSELEAPKHYLYLCEDTTLLDRREKLQGELDRLKAGDEMLSDVEVEATLSDEAPRDDARVAEIEREIVDIDEQIREVSTALEICEPSEDDLLSIARYHEKQFDEWTARLLALTLGRPKETVYELRKRVNRGTYMHLFAQALEAANGRSRTVPFSLRDSQKTPD